MILEVFNSDIKCEHCGKDLMVTDSTIGERFCGGCGFVITERVEE